MNHLYNAPNTWRDHEIREAMRALKSGEETIIHNHSDIHGASHTYCEMYVLDWHNELPYAGIRQVAVIFAEDENAVAI